MNKIKTFFRTLVQSVANPQYYNDVLKAPTSFSWKYFFVLNLLLSLLVLVNVLPPVYNFDHQEVITQVADIYPEELEMTFSPQGLEINQELPYVVPFPEEEFNQLFGEEDQYAQDATFNGSELDEVEEFNLVTFVADEDFGGLSDFYAMNSLIVLTETSAYIYDDVETSEVRAYDLTQFEETFTFNEAILNNFVDQVLNHPFFSQRWYVPLIAFATVFLFLPMTVVIRVLTVALYSVAVWFASKLFFKSRKLSYGDTFQMGLHLLTLPMLLKYGVDLTQFTTQFTGFWFFLAYFGWAMLVLNLMSTSTAEMSYSHSESSSPSSAESTTSSKKSTSSNRKKSSASKAKKAKKG